MNTKKIFESQAIRFLFVGVLNTIVGYSIYSLLVYLGIHYLIANTISTIIGIFHSYLWNRYFTFKSKEKAGKEILKFVSVYIISYLLGTCTLFIFTNAFKISPYISGFINLFITTLISWVGHKYFSFRKEISMQIKAPMKWLWALLLIIFISLFVNFIYGDIFITTNTSIIFDDLFIKGKLINLYSATFQNLPGFFSGTNITYDFPIYIFFGIWNIPLYIFSKLSTVEWINSFVAILYAKSFLIVLTFITLFVMKKILDIFKLTKDDKKMYWYLFLSSSLVLMVIAMFGGYEILSILFTLLGIYYYLKEDNPKFIFFFAIATSLKLFALLIFIPLVLLKEKRIWKIGISCFSGISLLLLSKIVYWNAPLYYESMHMFEDSMFSKLSLSFVASPFGNISLFITIYTIICIFCYTKKIKEKMLSNLYVMYIPLIVYSLFCILCQAHPQWIILFMPYMIFFLIFNKKDRKINLLLEICFSVTFLLILFNIYDWVFAPYLMDKMLLNQFIIQTNAHETIGIMTRITPYLSILNGLIIGVFGYFLWLNIPEKILIQKEKQQWSYSALLIRMLVIIPFALLIVFYYLR